MVTTNGEFDPVEAAVQQISAEGHPFLRDLAEGVMRGEMTLEELSISSVDMAAVQQKTAARYLEWRNDLTKQEQETLAAQVAAYLERMRAEVAAEESGHA